MLNLRPLNDTWGKQSATSGDPITITMPRILPCLRCGSDKVDIIKHWHIDHASYQCQCEKYHAWDEWLDTEAEAIAAWNERPIYVMTSAEAK